MANNIDRPNIADADYQRDVVRRLEAIQTEKDSEKGAYLKRCQEFNTRMDDILEEAKTKGLPKKALKGILKLREFDRKKEALVEALEDDQQQVLVSIQEALGAFIDTPLGAAAATTSPTNRATVGTAGPTAVEKGPRSGKKQDPTTAAIVGAVLAGEPEQNKGLKIVEQTGVTIEESDLVPQQTDIEDEAKKQAEIEEQRKKDAEEFDKAPPPENVTRLDPSAARRNRSGGRTKADEASAAARAAEATSEQTAKQTARIVGAEPGPIKF